MSPKSITYRVHPNPASSDDRSSQDENVVEARYDASTERQLFRLSNGIWYDTATGEQVDGAATIAVLVEG